MIVGRLADLARQKKTLPAAIVRALEILQTLDLASVAPERVEIDGERLFYSVEDVSLRTLDESRPEAHARYADIQLPLSGGERYGFALPQSGLVAVDDQLEARDLAFYPAPANESFIDLYPGDYVVFLPGELHRSALVIGEKTVLRKLVVKIHLSLLGLAD
jgi:biofilm protein TabA